MRTHHRVTRSTRPYRHNNILDDKFARDYVRGFLIDSCGFAHQIGKYLANAAQADVVPAAMGQRPIEVHMITSMFEHRGTLSIGLDRAGANKDVKGDFAAAYEFQRRWKPITNHEISV